MTGQQIKDLVTEIRGGRELDDDVFIPLLRVVKNRYEGKRTWNILKKKSTVNTQTSSDTYETAKTLPADFNRSITYSPKRPPLILIDSNDSRVECWEIPLERLHEYKDTPGYFAIDFLNNSYYVTGTFDRTYTHNFFYIHFSADIALGTEWIFPDRYHEALAFEVAAIEELGLDFDDINARQGNNNAKVADLIMKEATKWDEGLTRNAIGV